MLRKMPFFNHSLGLDVDQIVNKVVGLIKDK